MDEKTLIYGFGEFHIDFAQKILLRSGQTVAITPKCFDTLVFLVRNQGRVLQKEDMLKVLWPDSHVEERNLNQHMYTLRKILGNDENGQPYIQTIPRRGYKFVASVKQMEVSPPTLPQSSMPADYWKQHSPFRGLQVFEPRDSWLFFGRDAEIADLLARLNHSPVLAIIGSSGCGKSSLVRAGLIPALQHGHLSRQGSVDSWRIAVFRPSGKPFDYLAEILPQELAPELNLSERTAFIADCRNKFPSGADALRNAVTALAGIRAENIERTRVLLVADQFEELFTLTSDHEVRDRYIDLLLTASGLEGVVPVYLVMILRADFYGHCLEHLELSHLLENNLYNVPRMTREHLRESVERRLALTATHAESGLIDSLLEDVGAEPGNLALMEHALSQLWEKREGFHSTLTNKAYAEIGRLRGALSRYADEVYADINDEEKKQLARRIFMALVQFGEGAQDTRRRIPKADILALGKAEPIHLLLSYLASKRLLSIGNEGQQTFVEVSHEALIREWATLREWIAQDREEIRLERRLVQDAEEWQALNRDRGALLQGVRLAHAQEWLARQASPPSFLKQFIETSSEAVEEESRQALQAQERELAQQQELLQQAEARAEAEKQLRNQQQASAVQSKRSAGRLRLLSSGLAGLLLVALVAAWSAYREGLIERSIALSAQASELLTQDHGQALDLAIRAFGIAKTEEARFAVAKALPELLATLRHEGPIERAVFSPDGQRILTASYDHSARVWNAENGGLLLLLQGHRDKVEHATFSPDGKRIATASYDKTARVWDSSSGKLLAILQGHTDAVIRVAFSPDGQRIATASLDHTARIWNALDGRLLAILQHDNVVADAEFSADGRRIVSGSWDRAARIWDSADGHLLTTLRGHTGELLHAEYSPKDQRIVTASRDQTARVWDGMDGRLLATLQHRGPVIMARFSADGLRIVTASTDNTACVWSIDGLLVSTLRHEGPVQYAEFSSNSQYVISASFDSTARLWNSTSGRLLAVFQGHGDQVMHAAFSGDNRIVTAGNDSSARVWNVTSGRRVLALQAHTDRVYGVVFSPDGLRIATAGADGTARIWNTASGSLVTILQGHTDRVYRAVFSPDGRRIATASEDDTARLWDSENGRLIAVLKGHSKSVWDVAFSPDGYRVVTSSSDQTARIWNNADGRLLATLEGHTGPVWFARFSPDGLRIITTSSDKTARLWSSINGHLLATLQGHSSEVINAQFSVSGQQIVTASLDKTARVWSATDGHLLVTLQGHESEVVDAQFSPDGQRIVTAGADSTARIWDASDGRVLVILRGHTSGVRHARFSADGQRIITASLDKTARIWDSHNGKVLAILQGHTDIVRDATFSQDDQRIVTGSFDHTARVWSVVTLTEVEKLLAK